MKKMKGTEKQIAWAEDIKAAAINYCDHRIAWEIEYRGSADTLTAKLYRINKASLVAAFAQINDAARIIEHRASISERAIEANAMWAERLIEAGKMTIEQIAAKNGVTEY